MSNRLNVIPKIEATGTLAPLQQALDRFLSGKPKLAESVLCALLAKGHVLFEDIPGVGKTTLAKVMSKWLGLTMSRVQCTSDLLPSDILGVEVFKNSEENFVFNPGPIFSQLVFVDELNRASPRTQSALLEAMAEGSVTIQKRNYPLPHPFLLFAAQNPSNAIGTYALPESQLDRFSIKVSLGYPSLEKELSILEAASTEKHLEADTMLISPADLESWQKKVDTVTCNRRVSGFARRVLENSRSENPPGLSTRAGVLWMRMAKARALVYGRDYVIPDDLVELAAACLSHRLASHDSDGQDKVAHLLMKTPVE